MTWILKVNSRESIMVLRQYMAKTNTVADWNPYFSTKIPDNVGPRKLPRKNENDHIPRKQACSYN